MATTEPATNSESDDDSWGYDPEQFNEAKEESSCNSSRNMQLCIAVHDGDVCAVTALVEAGADVNFIVENSATRDLRKSVLAVESLEKQIEMLEQHCMGELPHHYKCPSLPRSVRDWEKHFHFEFGHCTPLKIAVLQKRVVMVERLLQLGSRTHTKHPEEDYVIFTALRTENQRIVQQLLAGGADPNVRDSQNFTLLYHAINRQCIEILRDLLEYGALVEQRSKKIGSCLVFKDLHPRPLMLAAGLWENDHELALELVLAGAETEGRIYGSVDYVEGMASPLDDPSDMLSWAVDKIRSCGVLTAFCRLLIRAGVPVLKRHVDRAHFWVRRVVRHTASRPGMRRGPPAGREDTNPEQADTIPDPNVEVRDLLKEAFRTPPCLLAACRRQIRRRLCKYNGGQDVRKVIRAMDILPEVVRSYLAMDTLMDECHLYSVSSNASGQSQSELSDQELRALLGLV